MKLKKQAPGYYTTEGTHNGQSYTIEFNSGEYGWEWTTYVDGHYRGGQCPGLGCRLKDLKQTLMQHGPAAFIC